MSFLPRSSSPFSAEGPTSETRATLGVGRGSNPIVLQPCSLIEQDGNLLADRLEAAIGHSQDIILDLLWIDQLTREALKPIVPVVLKAKQQGVDITLLSMPCAARSMFEQMLHQGSRESNKTEYETGYSVFSPEFEAFLDHHHNTTQEITQTQ
jgi:hypothetical protein